MAGFRMFGSILDTGRRLLDCSADGLGRRALACVGLVAVLTLGFVVSWCRSRDRQDPRGSDTASETQTAIRWRTANTTDQTATTEQTTTEQTTTETNVGNHDNARLVRFGAASCATDHL